MCSGCAALPLADLEYQADRLRDAAMTAYERGDRRAPLDLNKQALALTAHLPPTSWRTVENYDDAGLYYYGIGEWQASTRHQAIAVLLACGTKENAEMYPAYVVRLGWALAKYRPGQDFDPILDNPLVLLEDRQLALLDNEDLRRRLFIRYAAPNASRSSRPWYVYVQRPLTCGRE